MRGNGFESAFANSFVLKNRADVAVGRGRGVGGGDGGAYWGGSVEVHSRPKVLVSSTAVSIFSYSMENEGYGGRSRRLKHV